MQSTFLAALLAVAHEPAFDTSTVSTVDVKGHWQVVRAERDGGLWNWPILTAQFGNNSKLGSMLILWRSETSGYILGLDGPFNGSVLYRCGPINLREMRDVGQWMPGIYYFHGDTLTICWSDGERPPGDITRTGPGQTLIVLKRK